MGELDDPGSEKDLSDQQVTLVCTTCGMDKDVHEDVADCWEKCPTCRMKERNR